MPFNSSNKTKDSPKPETSNRVKIDDPKTNIIEEAAEMARDPESTPPPPPEVEPSTSMQDIERSTMSNGTSKGHSMSNGKGSSNGILKHKSEEEKWKNNYVPCVENKIDGKAHNGDIAAAKHVTEIFEEVFREPRGNWALKLEYIASCLGFTIGLSSFWRFPLLIHKYGGGAFLFCYCLISVLIGLPLYFMENGLAQFAQLGCVHVWRCAPLFQGVGTAMLVLSLIAAIYNSQVVAYTVHYFFSSFVNLEGMVLWGECRPVWGSCHDSSSESICASVNSTFLDPNDCWQTSFSSSKYYWKNRILRITDLNDPGKTGPLHWDLALCLLFVWFFAFLFSMKGIRSSGKVALCTGMLPFCILIAFLVASVNKPGALKGLTEFYMPDWDKLMIPEVWQKAVEQVILSLGVTYGGIITIGSYNKFYNKRIQGDAIILTFMNLILSVMAATTLFASCGVFAQKVGLDDPTQLINIDVTGIEILFIFYPDLIARVLPYPHVWAIFFFIMLLCLGLHTQYNLLEVTLTTVYDAVPRFRRKKTLLSLCLVIPLFLLSLPMCSATGNHIFHLLGTSIIGPNITLIAILQLIGIFYFYGIRRFCRDMKIIREYQPSIIWKVLWIFISPVGLIVLFVFCALNWRSVLYEDRDQYPDWSLYLTWALVLLPLAMIPIDFIFAFIYKLYKKENILQPSSLWGPGCDMNKYTSSHNSASTSEENLSNTNEHIHSAKL